MEVWPRRLDALRTARISAMSSSSSRSEPALFWFLCCFLSPCVFLGAACDRDGLGWAGRRLDSKLDDGIGTDGTLECDPEDWFESDLPKVGVVIFGSGNKKVRKVASMEEKWTASVDVEYHDTA